MCVCLIYSCFQVKICAYLSYKKCLLCILYHQSENSFLWVRCMYMRSTNYDWCIQKRACNASDFKALFTKPVAHHRNGTWNHLQDLFFIRHKLPSFCFTQSWKIDLPVSLPIGTLCRSTASSVAVCQSPVKGPLLPKWSILLTIFFLYIKHGWVHFQSNVLQYGAEALSWCYHLYTAPYTWSLQILKAHCGNAFWICWVHYWAQYIFLWSKFLLFHSCFRRSCVCLCKEHALLLLNFTTINDLLQHVLVF